MKERKKKESNYYKSVYNYDEKGIFLDHTSLHGIANFYLPINTKENN